MKAAVMTTGPGVIIDTATLSSGGVSGSTGSADPWNRELRARNTSSPSIAGTAVGEPNGPQPGNAASIRPIVRACSVTVQRSRSTNAPACPNHCGP